MPEHRSPDAATLGPVPEPSRAPLLEVVDLTVRFGGVTAVDQLSFSLPHGTLTGLIGPNGAGKTTTIDAVSGFVPSTGRVRFDGAELSGAAPHRRARSGMARTWQSLELFDDLTVRENAIVASHVPRPGESLIDAIAPHRHATDDAVDEALDLVGLRSLADRLPTELSNGQRKLAAVARALAARPQLLLLDEPAAGLDSTESLRLGERLRAVVDHGVTMLLVDHDMGLVLSVCEELVVLDFGRRIAGGSPQQVREDPRVIEAYLGQRHDATTPEGAR